MGPQSNSSPHRCPFYVCAEFLLITLALTFAIPRLHSQTISQTIATTVPLILPSAVTFDSQGNLYIAETGNHVIRKVDLSGQITTIAGNGTQGYSGDSGPATSAQLDSPQGLAIDSSNHLYIADTHNNSIRALNLGTGIIATVAGNPKPGFDGDNGPATSAHLNQPTALVVDSTGNLYIADSQNHRIRKVTTTGIITTIAGSGIQGISDENALPTSAKLDSPTGLAVDASGNLYIADTHNNRIRKVTAATGLITTIAGTGSAGFSGDGSSAVASTLALPRGVTVDASGNLYIADTANHRIRRVDATTATITTYAGNSTQNFSGDAGPATAASLNTPRSAMATPTNLLLLADSGNQRIRQVASNATIQTVAGLSTATPVATDFTLAVANPSSQSVVAGDSVTFAFSAQTQGSLSSPITLAASGLPPFATASFTPNFIPPGSASSGFTLTIALPKANLRGSMPKTSSFALAILILPLVYVRKNKRVTVLFGLITVVMLSATGCGDRIYPASQSPQPTPYTITVTGTATSPEGTTLQHTATVTLRVTPN
jgi:sugar lactone lactonase YvrE